MNKYSGNQAGRQGYGRGGRGVLLGDYGTTETGEPRGRGILLGDDGTEGRYGTHGASDGASGRYGSSGTAAHGAPQGDAQEQAAACGRPIFSHECRLSALGKVTEKIETGPLGRDFFTYTYDAAGHLTEVRKNEMLVEYYQFDEDGRRIQDFRSWAGERRNLTYNYDGALIQAGNARLTWTAKGQLSAMEQHGQGMSFSYGTDSRLDRVRLANGYDVRYFYGKELLPVEITYNGATVAEYQWKNTLRLERCRVKGLDYVFVYGQERAPVQVTVSGTAEAVYRATGIHNRQVTLQIFTDQVDSVRVLALPDGRPVKCIEYDSFGNVAVDTRPDWHFPLGFACGLNDRYTGFVRFGFRDYDPRFGRFTAKDPLGDTGGDHDLWDYCVDDPVSCNDPSGLFAFLPALGYLIAGLGTALGIGAAGSYGAAKAVDAFQVRRGGKGQKTATSAVDTVMPYVTGATAAGALGSPLGIGAAMEAGTAAAPFIGATATAAQRGTNELVKTGKDLFGAASNAYTFAGQSAGATLATSRAGRFAGPAIRVAEGALVPTYLPPGTAHGTAGAVGSTLFDRLRHGKK